MRWVFCDGHQPWRAAWIPLCDFSPLTWTGHDWSLYFCVQFEVDTQMKSRATWGWREPELRAVLWDRKLAPAAGAGKGLKFMFLQWTQTSSYSPCSPYTCSFPIPHVPRLLPFYKSLLLYTFADSSCIQVSVGEEWAPHSDICPHPIRGIMKQTLLKLGGKFG